MPRRLADLPFDVLSEIWEYLAGDQCALRASALTCKTVLPLSQRHLFATVDFAELLKLGFSSAFALETMRPSCVASNPGWVSKKLASIGSASCPSLSSYPDCAPSNFTATAGFITATTPTLRGTVHTKLAEAKQLINSLPALAHLPLADINIRTSVFFGIPCSGNPPAIVDENEFDEDADRAGPRLVSLWVECRRSRTGPRSPTAHTLRRLVLLWEGIRDTLVPLATFGPSVEDLAFSLDDLAGIHALRVREVLSDDDWILLASLLAKLPPRRLRLLELHYAHATITPLPSPAVLARGMLKDSSARDLWSRAREAHTAMLELQGIYDQIVTDSGCASANDTLQCLRTVSTEVLKAAMNKSPSFVDYVQVNTPWNAHADGVFMTELSQHLLLNGHAAEIPIVVGNDEYEGTHSPCPH
ncbi:hypothetical protein BN946_scf184382.g8 [Trametes cinnabarina]|uniref:Uncharacterized protein n=1 Tax=Pycnoporus cinnabarinus TaxID=5643 RepID=A0A060S376_PYCCI|nr:hypothetical protein BN946_scf184382.g8 [Trametes cinnabarina]